MINLKRVDFEKLDKLPRVTIPGTQTNRRLSGYFGYFESRDGYNKLIAYGPEEKALQISWIHSEYLKK